MALKQEREEHHILMVACAAQGHLNPMLRLAKRLVSKGLSVTFSTTEVVRHQILSHSTSATAGINLAFFSDGLSLDYDRKSNMDHFLETLAKCGPINLSTLIHNHSQGGSPKFSCIISNQFVPWVADVAAEHAIPCAMAWIQPCTLYSIYYRFYNHLSPFPTSSNPTMSVDLPGLPLLNTRDLPCFVLPSNPYAGFSKLLSELFQIMKKKHRWVLANSFHELEKDVIESMSELCPITPLGPLVPSTLLGEDVEGADSGIDLWKSEDATCIEWLNLQEPLSVVYISFGSLIVLPNERMASIAIGLKNSKRPFLWVVKPPEFSAEDGHGQLPLGFAEETKDLGLIVSWSPQTKVLSHPSVGCFLSHCGWNSMLETIAAGVPVICYPQKSDQPTNANLIADVIRVGVRLRPNQDGVVTHEEVEKCIEEVMAGQSSDELKKKAAELKAAARDAVAVGGSSDRNIQWFVEEIKGNSCTSTS